MEICTCSSTFLLALLLTFSVQGLAVVARVRLAGTQYLILEQQQEVCIDVINDEYDPRTAIDFTVTYVYDTALSGESGSALRSDQLFFSSSSNTAQLCIHHQDDTVPCEPNITGIVYLDGSDLVAIGHPNSAQVTVQDDDFINASFVEAFYTLLEGGNNQIMPLVNTSASSTDPIMLDILQGSTNVNHNTIGRSLYFEPTSISLHNTQEEGISLDIQDDDIALEDPEEVVLQLSVPSQASCSNVNLSPLKSTRILIIDNDYVTVNLTTSSGTVLEGESYPVCVALSQRIARRLDIVLHIRGNTADSSDMAIHRDRNMLTFTSTSESTKCTEISTIQDHVIESDESFQVELSVVTVLPGSLKRNLIVGETSSTITIQDTSTCTDVSLDPLSTDSVIYIQKRRTLCFSCTTCSTAPSWNLTSHQGHIWAGKTGEHSESSLPFRAEVLANGTLLILNSSLVFDSIYPGTLSFSEDILSNSSVYEVYIQEDVEITELTVSCTIKEEVARVTCLYRGSPAPHITWLADKQLVSNGEISSETSPEGGNYYKSTLLVDGAVSSTYTCTASSRFGSKNSTVDTLRCRDNIANTIAISSSTAISSLSTANYCVIITFIIISHYM